MFHHLANIELAASAASRKLLKAYSTIMGNLPPQVVDYFPVESDFPGSSQLICDAFRKKPSFMIIVHYTRLLMYCSSSQFPLPIHTARL